MLARRASETIVDSLSDSEIERVNLMFPWSCFTLDSRGRPVGRPHSATKRAEPQPIPDPRLTEFGLRYNLSQRSCLEVGCFEGVHSIGLCEAGATVHATDGRIENILKTIIRLRLYGYRAEVSLLNVDVCQEIEELAEYDYICNIGVLYHLEDPVQSLKGLLAKCRIAMLLDTQVVKAGQASGAVQINGKSFDSLFYREGGILDPFSGLANHAVWISEDAIFHIADECGFAPSFIERRDERNGARITVHLARN